MSSEIGSLSNDTVPISSWEIFPPNASYLKEILQYCGCSTFGSLLKLEKREELNKIFDFVKEMAEDMTSEERIKILGVFKNNPQKLRILPGLEDVFTNFLKHLRKLKGLSQTDNDSDNLLGSRKKRATKQNNKEIDEDVTVFTVSRQLEDWVKSISIDDETLQKRLRLCSKEVFSECYTVKSSNDGLRCVCQICYSEIVLPKKTMANRVSLSISNVTRHIKNCWLKPDFKPPQDGAQDNFNGAQKKLASYFQPNQSNPISSPSCTEPTAVDLVEEERVENLLPPPDGCIHFHSETAECSDFRANATKRLKLENQISRISTKQSSSKNLHQPAGI